MADQAVEAPPQVKAAPPPSLPMHDATSVMMPDDVQFGGPETQAELRHLEEAQAAKAKAIPPDAPPKPSGSPEMNMEDVLKILSDAKPKGDSPVLTGQAPTDSGVELPAHIEQPQAKVIPKQTNGTGVWKWDWKDVQRFVDQLKLGTKTVWQKIIAFPKAVFKWIFNDTGSNSKPTTPLRQSRPTV
ncbi:hypothetical protein COY90_03400 [Candidatus Roizmanbacteria bacterium CG_4_10_14_0_8_um_filter_39_9]|uniref:Uncharacterized protein n=1 Tax=Candidatus Roizmanbacteria bacterium CG_4_10_14_0_8_um_filter_39_9 TaxID=1974829 RepID=A0A2M7QCH4_9BACT|nr:MAG: hypothetical protein COY90_03400 [Candidatus Roizmanbacteria bacterium CG_4_10_14_0_8_um_filter_39_9]